MRRPVAFLFVILGTLLMQTGMISARPFYVPTVPELMQMATVVVVIKPKATRATEGQPDDASFGSRDLALYQALETECEVLTVLKGPQVTGSIKVVHFAFASRKPEFNGGHFMAFLFDPTLMVVFPKGEGIEPDTTLNMPYAEGAPEYLAFLRKTQDGRYAPVGYQYDAAHSFRLLSTPVQAQRYHDPKGSTGEKEKQGETKVQPDARTSK